MAFQAVQPVLLSMSLDSSGLSGRVSRKASRGTTVSDSEMLHPVPVRDLTERLGLSKSRVFALLSELAIARTNDGGLTCVSGEDFLLLEQALAHTRNGGTLAEFKASRGMAPLTVADSSQQSTQSGGTPVDLLLTAMATLLDRQSVAAPPPALAPAVEAEVELSLLQRRLDILRTLADARMSLSNSELADVLDLSPGTLRSRGQTFTAYGLRFDREQQGRAVSWRVSRPGDHGPLGPVGLS